MREIMSRYLKASSIKALVEELAFEGLVSKRRVSRKSNVIGGVPFKSGALKWLLSNPVYVGEVKHKGKTYNGQHKAIVDREIFDAVQAKLADRTSAGSAAGKHTRIALLAGMMRDDQGRPMSPTHTRNHGRRYTYYASNMNDDASVPALRLPAGDIEQAVRSAVTRWMRATENLQPLITSMDACRKTSLLERAGELAREVEGAPISTARAILGNMKLNVAVSAEGISGTFDPGPALLIEAIKNRETVRAKFEVPLDRHTYGHEPKLRLQPSRPDHEVRDDRLVELLGRSFAAREKLLGMNEEQARAIKTTRLRHLQRLARISYLNPDIIRSILAGTQPKHLGSRSIWRVADLPIRWADQNETLHIANI